MVYVLGIATVSSYRTIRLVDKVAEKLNINPGDRIIFYESEGKISIKSANEEV